MFAATTDIKGYLLTGRYQPYLLLGGGALHVKTEVTNPTGVLTFGKPTIRPVTQSRKFTDFVIRLGGGFDVYATDHVVVNISASYLFPLGEVSGVELFTAGGGIEYRF
jgi:opacity protein-like surface antigen